MKPFRIPTPFPFLAVLTALVLYGLLSSCNPAKQAARADAKALDRVRGSGRLQDSLLQNFLNRYPCANDSITVIKPGGFDTTTLGELLKKGSLYYEGGFGLTSPGIMPYDTLITTTDALWRRPVLTLKADSTLIIGGSVYRLKNGTGTIPEPVSYEKGFRAGVEYILSQRVPVKRPDTLQTSILNKQRQRSDAEIIAGLKQQVAGLQAQVAEKELQVAETENESDKRLLYFILALVALILSNAAWIFLKLKNPLP